MGRPTINDVATAAGVSKGAVSFALNGRPGISADTRTRILEAAAEPRLVARAPGPARSRSPRRSRSGWSSPGPRRSCAPTRSSRLHRRSRGGALRPRPRAAAAGRRARDHAAYRRLVQEGRVDGVFVTDLASTTSVPPCSRSSACRPSSSARTWASSHACPVRARGGRRPGIRRAVQHLVDLGHRHIAHVSGPLHMVHGRSRREAWSAGAERRRPAGGRLRRGGLLRRVRRPRHARRCSTSPSRPTAVVFANDLMAMAGLASPSPAGSRVPGDLSVTGFDDTEISAHLQPSLTTVRTDVVAWGAAAATRLLQLIDDVRADPRRPPGRATRRARLHRPRPRRPPPERRHR